MQFMMQAMQGCIICVLPWGVNTVSTVLLAISTPTPLPPTPSIVVTLPINLLVDYNTVGPIYINTVLTWEMYMYLYTLWENYYSVIVNFKLKVTLSNWTWLVLQQTLCHGCTVGWSDIHLLSIFENGHYAADQVHFYESNYKKSANFAACNL